MISTPSKLTLLALIVHFAALPAMVHSAEPRPKAAKKPIQEARAIIAALKNQIDDLKLRIEAGTRAGEELERQLDDAHSLARREHAQAEKISAQVLEQIAEQKAIAQDLKTTVARVTSEREEILAKLRNQPRFDPEEKQRLIAQNQKLSKGLKDAWEKAKAIQQQAIAQRAEALRERILQKKLEVELEDIAEEARLAAEEAQQAADKQRQEADARAKLLDIAPIYFGKNQADSEAQERSLLAQITEIHRTFPDARFTIAGHTCTDGTPAGNLELSHRRAQHIAEFLKKNGIPAAALAGVVGKGQTSPIADNHTQQGREANRRVEIEILRE